MIRYEASLDGIPVIGEPFTNFDELEELKNIFDSLNWNYKLLVSGKGGYYCFEIEQKNNKTMKLHIYLKRITFGGRESRPYEKRAQFSAALDRTGFNIEETKDELCIILGIYKSNKFPDVILCAWNVSDWGNNENRAFNCFVDIKKINEAIVDRGKIAQHRTSIGQIACCFSPELFSDYLKSKYDLHKSIIKDSPSLFPAIGYHNDSVFIEENGDIPNYSNLFQLLIDILKSHNGIANVDTIEYEAAGLLNLSDIARLRLHNEVEGYRTELGYQLAWARFYLKKSGFIENPKRGVWALTDLGWVTNIDRDTIIRNATQKEIQEEIETDLKHNIDYENDIESENDPENTLIENPFDPNQVDIRTRTMSLDLIIKRLRNNAIDMNTSFQRKANLWNITKQSRLIESILVRFPLPAFYFDGSNDDNWLVVDGLQRLSSLDNYVNKGMFGLQNLEFLNQFNDKKFNELPSYLQRRIEEFEITAYIIASGTPKILKFNVFKRINTGGLTLTTQEIRHALYQGKPSQFVRRLAEKRSFKIATSYSIPEDRMLDQEFVTRFLAFYMLDFNLYNSDLDSFLNKVMDELNFVEDLDKIEYNFDKAMNASIAIFGNYAFRKRFSRNDKRKPINKALFEVWAVLLSKLTDTEMNKLIHYKDALNDLFISLLNNNESFIKSITSATGDKSRIRTRFTEINGIIESTLKL